MSVLRGPRLAPRSNEQIAALMALAFILGGLVGAYLVTFLEVRP